MLSRELSKYEKLVTNLRPRDKVFEVTIKNGLSIRVTKTGKKVFQGRYSINGKRKRHDIGYFPALDLAQAYDTHSKIQNNIDEGLNPFKSEITTVFELFQKWYNIVGINRKRPEAALYLINADIKRVFFKTPISKLRKDDFRLMFEDIQQRGSNTQAERTRVLCKQVMSWSTQLDYIESNPIADLTSRAIGYKYKPRDRFLNDDEIGIVWNALDAANMSSSTINVLKIMMLTGMRRAEPFLAKWSDIDLKNKIWLIPPANNKSNRSNEVMLPKLLVDVLNEQKSFVDSIGSSNWVFPNVNDASRHMDPMSVTRAVRRHCERNFFTKPDGVPIPSWTPHALRHTFETKLTEIGVDYVTMKRMLNHEVGNMSGVYNHADLRDRKMEAMNKWCLKIEKLGKQIA